MVHLTRILRMAGDGSFCRDDDCLDLPTWNHLWFVAYLWCYTVVLWVLLRLAPRTSAGAVERVRGLLAHPAGLLWPLAWLAVARLLLPLVFGMLVIVPPQSYFEVVEKLPGGYHDGYLAFWARYLAGDGSFCRDDDCLDLPTWNHLWFVAYLWCYTVVLWVLLRLAPRTSAGAVERVRGLLAHPAGLLWPLAWLAIARLLLVGRFESTHALVDDWYNHAQYLPLFLLGFAIARPGPLWDRIERARWPALVATLASWLFIAWYFGQYRDGGTPPESLRQLQRLLWAVQQWGAIVAILGFFRRHAPGDSPARRWLAEAVFPVYILHQTVIVLLAVHLRPLDLPAWLEGPLLVLATLLLCLAGYELVRRLGWVRPLFGLKRTAAPSPARDGREREAVG